MPIDEGKSDPAFLKQLEQESKAAQQLFIRNIADRLGRTPADRSSPPAHPYRGAPDFWRSYELGAEERVQLFMVNWQAAGGYAERLPDLRAARASVERIVHEMNVQVILRQNQEKLSEMQLEELLPDSEIRVWNGLTDSSAEAAAGADMGMVEVDYAVANTGSIVVTSSRTKGRSVTLLPNVMVAIIPVESMVTRLGEAMKPIADLPKEQFPAGVHFISGPSRSSDIENDLTIGVHGPGVVFALLIG